MNKEQLLELAKSLNVLADKSMTNDEILAAITAKTAVDQSVKMPTDASASPSSTKKQSVVKGWNYTYGHVLLVFANGDKAILGDKTGDIIAAAIAVKGNNVDYTLGNFIANDRGGYYRVFIDCIY